MTRRQMKSWITSGGDLVLCRCGRCRLFWGVLTGVYSDVIVFTYTMAGESNSDRPTIPRRIACKRNGVYTNIPAGSDPALYMTQYYQYLAAGVGNVGNRSAIRWSTPYLDGGGLGWMMSVARPVYTTVGSITQLVGAVGTDVLMEQLTQHGEYRTVVSEVISRSSFCAAFSLSGCVLQQLRYASQGASDTCSSTSTCSVCGSGDTVSQAAAASRFEAL